jgi:Family of unknown function (DUF5681)
MTENDDSGYKRPPKSARFKPGQSGNKRGRPKGSRNLKTDLHKIMKKRIAVREDGEVRHVSGQEAMLLSLFEKAIRGDFKASSQLFAMLMKFDIHDPIPPEPPNITENDRAIVEEFLRRNAKTTQEDGES